MFTKLPRKIKKVISWVIGVVGLATKTGYLSSVTFLLGQGTCCGNAMKGIYFKLYVGR